MPHPSPAPTPSPDRPEAPEYDRATFYFTPAKLMALEVLMLRLRTGAPRLRVGKSEIMRAALDYILEDYEARGAESFLVERLRCPAEQSA